MDIAALKKEAKSKKTAPSRLEELARHPDPSVQQAVAGNEKSPAAAMEYLGGHGKFNILKAVARNPNTPDEILEKLSRHKQATVREAVASRETLAEPIALHLTQDPEQAVKLALINSWYNHSAKVWQALAQDPDAEVRAGVAGTVSISDTLFEQFFSDPSPQVRHELGYNFKIEKRPEWQLRLAQDPDPEVRSAALRHGGPEIIELLSHDPHEDVRSSAAETEIAALEVYQRLSQDPSPSVRMSIAQNSMLENWPPKIAQALTRDSSEQVRFTLATNYSAHPSTLEALAHDPSPQVRFQVAENINSPISALELLSQDPYPGLFEAYDEFRLPDDPEPEEGHTIAQEAEATLEFHREQENP